MNCEVKSSWIEHFQTEISTVEQMKSPGKGKENVFRRKDRRSLNKDIVDA